MSCYEEFALLPERARELGLPPDCVPAVRREALELASGRRLSLLVWGRGPAQLVLVHGGALNAHTWDRVALLLGRPLIAVDLAGHGNSDWRADRGYSRRAHAELVRRLVLVDVTPGSWATAARSITRFVHDAPRPATFEQLVDYAVASLPGGDTVAIQRAGRPTGVAVGAARAVHLRF